jgi:photosystem II stability/assembly factor-like uncharacterized protein
MEQLLIAYANGLVRAEVNGTATAERVAEGTAPYQQFAVDPNDPSRVYVATLGDGLHRSGDGGRTFKKAPAKGLKHALCWTVAVSASDVNKGCGTLYVGTQQSAIYRSVDGGETFAEITSVQELDQSDWAFPPAPSTHHVHQITLDIEDPGTIVFGVELGGVYHSSDGGDSWTITTADPDPHTLRSHPTEPHRIYEGGGAGPALSQDGGATWHRPFEGIPDDVRYFFSLAVDSGDPENVIISGARDPFSGHGVFPDRMPIYSTLLRRQGDNAWETLSKGLPPDDGTPMGTLAAGGPGVFYYMTDHADLYRSQDGGSSFTKIEYDAVNTGTPARALAVLPA